MINMTIVGSFILPHGSMILDPLKENLPQTAKNLHEKMILISKRIEELQPNLILLTSPHSISLNEEFGLYLNNKAEGSAEWEEEYQDFSVEVSIASETAKKLLSEMKAKKLPITGITAFTPSVAIPLRWGESVPLWFLRNLSSCPEYLFLSQPTKRYSNALNMRKDTIQLGEALAEFLDELDKRVLVIISADLSHTHSKEGPYHYDEVSEPFDQLLEEWASTLDEKKITLEVENSLERALCCGYIGFLLLQGIANRINLKPNVLINEHPTYYGMMIAEFLRK
jgi:aromatic ring-opening dioxygenase LigB subunit